MFYYSHHIGDLIRDTANLDDHQLATYMRMLWSYYDTEKPLKNNIEDLAFALRSNEKTVQLLLKHYFKLDGDVWRHTRCDIEIADYHSKKEKASNSAKARWTNAKAMPKNSERNASALKDNANAMVLHANQEPRTNNQKNTVERTTRGARLSIHFEPDFDFAKQNGVSNPTEEFAKFRDYWNSQAGAKAVKTDWQATWRNWCRNSRKDVQKDNYEPRYAKYMREKMEQISPSIAAKNPNNPVKSIDPNEFLRTIEAQNVIRIN